jgi:hypothetical protein
MVRHLKREWKLDARKVVSSSPFLWNVMIDDILRIVFPFLYMLIA